MVICSCSHLPFPIPRVSAKVNNQGRFISLVFHLLGNERSFLFFGVGIGHNCCFIVSCSDLSFMDSHH